MGVAVRSLICRCVSKTPDGRRRGHLRCAFTGNDRFVISALDAQTRVCPIRPFTGWEASGYHTFDVMVDVDDTVDEADEENNSTTVRVLRPTIPRTCSPSATPTRTNTPSPTLRRTPSATPTSCVSEPPIFYDPTPASDNPFVWHVVGRSRVLLNGRGHVSTSLNGQPLPIDHFYYGNFEVVATFEPGSSNVLAFCRIRVGVVRRAAHDRRSSATIEVARSLACRPQFAPRPPAVTETLSEVFAA